MQGAISHNTRDIELLGDHLKIVRHMPDACNVGDMIT